MAETITIEKEKLQKLVDNFFEACGLCDELNIYESEELDESMQEMKSWTEKNFGRKLH